MPMSQNMYSTLAAIKKRGPITSYNLNRGTCDALVNRGLASKTDGANGATVKYSVTDRGLVALVSHYGPANPIHTKQ